MKQENEGYSSDTFELLYLANDLLKDISRWESAMPCGLMHAQAIKNCNGYQDIP